MRLTATRRPAAFCSSMQCAEIRLSQVYMRLCKIATICPTRHFRIRLGWSSSGGREAGRRPEELPDPSLRIARHRHKWDAGRMQVCVSQWQAFAAVPEKHTQACLSQALVATWAIRAGNKRHRQCRHRPAGSPAYWAIWRGASERQSQ